ncbi:FAD/NAD(P)-binding protein [Novipirellula sp.]|uniref:FAD/NAD(P)-binding protein n=1 Tax=Novipirellula sp. TaxID=2795430 RepID=UPI003565B219
MSIGFKSSERFKTSAESSVDSTFRLAIVGCGPRGMYCLERLTHAIEQQKLSGPVQIDIYEPAAYPGAGMVYDPRQPEHLRMNFTSRQIDTRHPDQRNHPVSSHNVISMSFLEWAKRNRPQWSEPEGYAPRAVVGEYLHDCFQQVLKRLRPLATVNLYPTKVVDIEHADNRWILSTAEDDTAYDEVVLAVGHEGWRSAESYRIGDVIADIPCVFPTETRLSADAVPADSVVAVRGFGLTWIDAALSLTEGRGGKFTEIDGRWSYQRSGREPKAIVPFSRSGRPMLPKSADIHQPQLAPIWNRYTKQLRILASTAKLTRTSEDENEKPNFRSDAWPIIINAATDALHKLRPEVERFNVRQWFRDWSRWRVVDKEVIAQLRHSYDVATGRKPVDEAWALGLAWRQLYPALVELVSQGGLAAESVDGFQRIATEMERIAFGPPAENIGRILAIYDAGLIDLRFLADGTPNRDADGCKTLQCGHRAIEVDRIIDATIPGPHQNEQGGILDRLSSDAFVHHNNTGLCVNDSGRLVQRNRKALLGIAVFGRVTEGSVLGNDTLSRTLHTHLDRWTESLVRSRSRTAA